jgi:hypothetical protein
MKKLGRPKRLHKHDENGVLLIRCPKCDEYKSKDFFHKAKKNTFQVATYCKKCLYKGGKGRKPNPTRINNKGQKEKFCTGCDSFKTFDAFNKDGKKKSGLETRCRKCQKSRKSYQESLQRQKDKVIEAKKILHQSVIDNGKTCSFCDTFKPHTSFEESKQYRDGFLKRCKDCAQKRKKELSKKYNRQKNERIMNDPIAKSIKNARRMILSAFRYVGSKKNAKTYEIIGLDAKTFEQWLRDVSRVKPETHNVHIDHVIPISWAQSHDEVLALSHFSNLQWLPHDENIRKRDSKIKQCDLFRVFEFTPYKKTIEEIINRNDFEIIDSKKQY